MTLLCRREYSFREHFGGFKMYCPWTVSLTLCLWMCSTNCGVVINADTVWSCRQPRQFLSHALTLNETWSLCCAPQIVAWRSSRIGCGQADCPDSPYKRHFICNYAVGWVRQSQGHLLAGWLTDRLTVGPTDWVTKPTNRLTEVLTD